MTLGFREQTESGWRELLDHGRAKSPGCLDLVDELGWRSTDVAGRGGGHSYIRVCSLA